jgi:hypothetical protein
MTRRHALAAAVLGAMAALPVTTMARDGLAAVVSDAPQHLRAAGGGSHQDRVSSGEQVVTGAVVSDAPADLRAKRRDLEAHERSLELARLPDTASVLATYRVPTDDASATLTWRSRMTPA